MTALQDLTFLEAKSFFQEFLVQQNLPGEIVWLFREDIIPRSDRLLIRISNIEDNEEFARNCYELGRKRNLGVCFSAFARLDSYSCSYIQLPLDEVDAEYSLMSNESLKCSVNTDLLKVQSINSALTWTLSKLKHQLFSTKTYFPPNIAYKNCQNKE